ncbi:MAG: 4Fe-4S dicluster domain-containing protein [Syntrophaceae bacterium]|mgnify:CR=1 FL=1|nr:4Fe-4S dicluster domain-containing protein [Syntrophaceae bacterium]
MDANRRTFLKTLASVGITTSLFGARSAGADITSLPGYPNQYGVLVDTTVCIGCRRCEWACKEWNKLPNQLSLSEYEKDKAVFDKIRRTNENTYTVVNRFENPLDKSKPIYVKKQCMHCIEPGCASSCFVKAFTKRPEGAVTYDASLCVGCRYCMAACPFDIPAYQYYDPWTPEVTKCTFCFDRIVKEGGVPACVSICPVETMTFGKRSDLVELAHKKIVDNPGRYVNHIYGEKEVGGVSWMYLSAVPFDRIGFRTDLGTTAIPSLSKPFLSLVSPVFIVIPALAMGLYSFKHRRDVLEQQACKQALEHKEGK